MSWSIGYDTNWKRDIGYGVPAYCDYPGCFTRINRGLSHVCGGEPYGGEDGCGLYFCGEHLFFSPQLCRRCDSFKPVRPTWFPPLYRPKPEHPAWIHWKLTHRSWRVWRAMFPKEVRRLHRLRPLSRQQRRRQRELARRA